MVQSMLHKPEDDLRGSRFEDVEKMKGDREKRHEYLHFGGLPWSFTKWPEHYNRCFENMIIFEGG